MSTNPRPCLHVVLRKITIGNIVKYRCECGEIFTLSPEKITVVSHEEGEIGS